MTYSERLVRLNKWYDGAPPDWRFQFVLWSLLLLGAINLFLTVENGFPFALLIVLGIIVIAAVRVPYLRGWLPTSHAAADDVTPANYQIQAPHWIVDLNHRYETMPEAQRFWVYPAVLVGAGAINMLLTIYSGFPFALLFLLALLALVVIRAPYAAGWYKSVPALTSGPSFPPEIEHTPTPVIASEPPPPAPVHAAPPPPAPAQDIGSPGSGRTTDLD